MNVNQSARSGGIIGISSRFLNIKVCCVFSLESPHRSDSNVYTQYTIFNIKKKITLNYSKSAAIEFFPRDSSTSSKLRANEVLLYILLYHLTCYENITSEVSKLLTFQETGYLDKYLSIIKLTCLYPGSVFDRLEY